MGKYTPSDSNIPEGHTTAAERETKIIEITPNLDLNFFSEFEQEAPPPEGLPKQLFNQLPELIRAPCMGFAEQAEREVFLVGSLAVVSGIMPNVFGLYDGQYYTPHLYAYILAPYGSGKGGLRYCRSLAEGVHRQRREEGKELEKEYRAELHNFKQGNTAEEPQRPGKKMLFLPANASKSGLLQLMEENEGMGIIFEMEGDSLADALKTEYGSYSDLLRKGYHHEPISFFRRTEQEYRDIERPALAVVLSSTFDQYLKLIPTPQNGLFSRFIHYNLTPSREFKNVFSQDKSQLPEYFEELSKEFTKIYNSLRTRKNPYIFCLKPSQKSLFLELFQEWKNELSEFISRDLEGTVNRLGLICFRLAMVFTTLRIFETGELKEELICDDADFDTALELVAHFKEHALKVYHRLPRNYTKPSKEAQELERELMGKAEQVALCVRLANEKKSYADIALEVFGDAKLKSKAYRWVNSKKIVG